ncbi:alpha/beta hydrolase family protein [Inhella gelatinilytica]|uniref:S9 family peptidase n=1 Tax=Inhella gelatinilytica TaxID=2795030 RepID=A0A931J0C5_9BURK|nr:prolyl oligopeptidase family serine peptidase [Inhella gelatinilytica]MBH9554325.1 S9 family peptidase [Inhella gelatinilytica]
MFRFSPLAWLQARIVVLPLALLSGLATAAAQPSAETFFRKPAVMDASLSPSGKRLAFSAPYGPTGRVGVFVLDLQTAELTPTRAAHFSDADVPSFDWVDDERIVFSVVDLQAGSGEDYRTAPGLFAAKFDGSELRALIEREGRSFVQSAESRIRTLHWNHKLLHVPVPSEDPRGARADEVIVGEMSGSGNELLSVEPLWLNTRTGATRSFDTYRHPRGALSWWFTPQGEPRLVLTRDKGRLAYHWFTPDGQGGGSWKQISEGTMLNPPPSPAWVGADTLYLEQVMGPVGESYVVPFDFSKGEPSQEPLVKAPGFDFAGSFISGRDGSLLGVRIDTDAEQTIWFSSARKALQALVDAALPGRVNRLSCRRCEADDAVVLVRSFNDRDPGQLLLHTRADGKWRRLSQVQPGIEPSRMATTDLQRIRARDGRDLPVWITGQKKGTDGKPLAQPAIVLVHGGPWVRIGHWRWEPMRQFLASRGYLVIEPEFRGSEGYGMEHLKAGFKQWGQAMQDDVADALLWAQKEGWANDKACIAGASYGGYSTLMGLIKHPDLYRCGAAWVAVTDPFLYVEGSWWVRDDIADSGRRYGLKDMVGDPKTDEAMLKANSPVEQAALIKAPLLLAFGEDDLRVPLAHGKRLRSALERAGRAPADWVVYAREGHGWRKPENQIDFAQRLERFFAQHLQR